MQDQHTATTDTRSAGFAAVPNWLLEDESITRAQLLVMVALTRFHGSRGVYPSHATIGKLSRLSPAAVKRALVELKDRGLVGWRPRRAKDGGATSNEYLLHFLAIPPLAHQELPPSSPGATPQLTMSYEQDLDEQDLTNNTPQPPKGGEAAKKASDRLDEWERFWQLYPRKVGKGQAWTAWKRAVKTTDPVLILEGLKLQLPALRMQRRPEGDFRPHPSTWLNGQRWTDELEPEKRPGGGYL